ncbi:amino-acid N-acetyltransferas-like protein subunit Mak10 [Westerdykella ornata]|uniref:Amino-acid N-acetyltransferas-like protein subunit Mak10 n=1 Tax=Westerdykella ornata TaxID=318751 RepID=A0A6A6JV40_WESOR|nr:amino-acid N-acetyltransferas-like protein subunit Mak10 [Westerdykella ornata]KAF2280481.1 amino-acid N-acetyltransferas-like protein subunit Mak10 [Westerdykella ornata]
MADPLRVNILTTFNGDTSHFEASDRSYQAALQQPRLPQRRIVDITEEFTKACSALKVGQLVKDEHFTLFESVSALEIMDPKMDSGFLQPGETLEDEYDTLAPLLPEEVLGIMDQLLCYEMAWHTGYTLSQTLFTSVYIDKLLWPEPKTLEQVQFYRGSVPGSRRPGPLLEVLRAYCLGLVKCCDFVIAKITARHYFEEEDFATHTYHRTLFPQIPLDVFLRELDAAVEQLDDPGLTITDSLRGAITGRLLFRKAFLLALDLDCPLPHSSSTWPPVLSLLPSISTTHQLSVPVPGAFSNKIQRRLASTVPPRPVVELAFSDAFTHLKQLCHDCEEATRVLTIPKDPIEFENFLWASASRFPAPLCYARSYFSTLLTDESTVVSTPSLPMQDLQLLVFPPHSPLIDPVNWAIDRPRDNSLPEPPRLQIAMLLDGFLERASASILDYWTALGQNACRLRRLLTHMILGFNELQMDAAVVDEDLARVAQEVQAMEGHPGAVMMPRPLETWTYFKKLSLVEKCILLGFAQDVYLPEEFGGMYTFLSLVTTRKAALLDTIYAHFSDVEAQYRRTGRPPAWAEDVAVHRDWYIDTLRHYTKGIQHLSAALGVFYTTMMYLGLVTGGSIGPFGDHARRYELRMRPFLALDPVEVPAWEDFKAHVLPWGEYSSPDRGFGDVLKGGAVWGGLELDLRQAREAFARVKKAGAEGMRAVGSRGVWEGEVQGLMKSCVGLGVAVVGVRGAVEGVDVDGDGGWRGRLGVRIEVPGIRDGGKVERYLEGWVVPRVVKN